MGSQLLYPPSVNHLSKQLNAGYTNADAVITLTNTTSVQNKPGVIVINRVDINGTRQPAANWTYIEYTATSGATLTGCTVISGGQDQALGKVVEFVSDVTQQQRILDAMANLVVIGTGAVDTTKVVTPATVVASYKAAGSDVTTGTSDTTIVTPKALKDGTLTGQAIASPVLSGAGGTAAGTLGYGATDHNLLVGDGATNNPIHIGHWKSWTPTLANITLGSGTKTGFYALIGKTVAFKFNVVLAADSTMGTDPTFTLPVTAAVDSNIFTMIIGDYGTAFLPGLPACASSTTIVTMYAINAASTYATQGQITVTTPITWAVNDYIRVSGVYEAA